MSCFITVLSIPFNPSMYKASGCILGMDEFRQVRDLCEGRGELSGCPSLPSEGMSGGAAAICCSLRCMWHGSRNWCPVSGPMEQNVGGVWPNVMSGGATTGPTWPSGTGCGPAMLWAIYGTFSANHGVRRHDAVRLCYAEQGPCCLLA